MSRHQQNLKRAAILAQENLMQKWMKLPEIHSQYRLKLNLSRRDNAKYYVFSIICKKNSMLENIFHQNISILGYSGWLGGDVVCFGSRYSDASS